MNEEDPEMTVIDVKDTSMRLKIEFPADNIQKIMIMNKKSKDDWQNILEKKIEDKTITEIIQDVNNLVPDTKYKFQAILTSKNGKIIQPDEIRITTKDRRTIRLSEENIILMKSICDEKSKQRIGFVGPKNGGKSSTILSILSLFLREHKSAINADNSDEVRRATLDVPIPNTNVTLVEFYGASDQSETYLTDVRNFIHGIIPEDAALNDTCQSNIPICFENAEQRQLDGIIIAIAATEPKENFEHIRQMVLLATNAGISSVVFVTKTDLLEGTAVTRVIEAMVTQNIPRNLIYYNTALHVDDDTGSDPQATQILSAISYLTKKLEEKQRALRVLIRPKEEDVFKQRWVEDKKSYINLLRLICQTFVLSHPPRKIYELKNGIKIAIENNEYVEGLVDGALIEFLS
jgi:hypothetical protein